MKFIHAADIHLDSPLRGLERYEGAPIKFIQGATRRAFENLIKLCLEERVDFLLIAGDIFDGDWRDFNSGLFFARQLTRLQNAGIQVFVIRGNHDAESQISRNLKWPANTNVFSSKKPETQILESYGVAIHGQSFASRSVTEDISLMYPTAIKDYFNIGLLHTSAGGRPGHENYAPCTLPGLLSKNYDYWALGHVHQREVLREDPWIVFPGNIQARHVREQGNKGCTMVTVESGRVIGVVHCDLDVARWTEKIVNLQNSNTLSDVLERTRDALSETLESVGDRIIAVRLKFKGRSKVHSELARDPEHIINECRQLANEVGLDQLWIEQVKFGTQSELDLNQLAQNDDPIGELIRFVRSLTNDTSTLQALGEDIKELTVKLPSDTLENLMSLDDPGYLQSRLPEVEQLLIEQLLKNRREA